MTQMLERPVEAVEVPADVAAAAVPMLTPEEFLALAPMKRLRYVMDWILANPEKHNQALWGVASVDKVIANDGEVAVDDCGTACCVAGWGALFAGATPMLGARPMVAQMVASERVSWESVLTAEGVRNVDTYASELFDLDIMQRTLFAPENATSELVAMVDAIERGESDLSRYVPDCCDDEDDADEDDGVHFYLSLTD